MENGPFTNKKKKKVYVRKVCVDLASHIGTDFMRATDKFWCVKYIPVTQKYIDKNDILHKTWPTASHHSSEKEAREAADKIYFDGFVEIHDVIDEIDVPVKSKSKWKFPWKFL